MNKQLLALFATFCLTTVPAQANVINNVETGREVVMINDLTSEKGIQDLNMLAIRQAMNFGISDRVEKSQKALNHFFSLEGRKTYLSEMAGLGFFDKLDNPSKFSMTTHYTGRYDNPADITKGKEGWWVSLPVQIEVKDENGQVVFRKQADIQTLWQKSNSIYGVSLAHMNIRK